MSTRPDLPAGAEEASSMTANEPETPPSVPPELRELETERGAADLYTGTEPGADAEPPPSPEEARAGEGQR
jgi:hypothetical protein